MKKLLVVISLISVCFSCKQKTETIQPEKELSTAEKIANAHGFENWENVSEIQFTFNVDKDSSHFERTWIWQPKTNQVTSITKKDTVNYNRRKVDSTLTKTDGGFSNDKYWLLVPFQLIWDHGATLSESTTETAPISKNQLNKITITYPNEGGYTPGDAYDIYFGNDYLIKEWIFRRGNQKKPSMITTFENYQDYNGIKLAKDHKKTKENWNLNFTNIKIKKE
ncbi:MAG: hypothetical protein P8K68_00420 [Algibacter sp.]|uniref:hypothetical protein n=1 Tax=Algibacter sp. TaxID=1872428 RepID=UPI002623FD69|nr:hypothetical protein [Algibacter sp.]MDG1729996.1 hypothetical protein [Algibacter sp.]MDG2177238.1 hypothetical protein [Algibacter sp.]